MLTLSEKDIKWHLKHLIAYREKIRQRGGVEHQLRINRINIAKMKRDLESIQSHK
jgi:hypothetical protein